MNTLLEILPVVSFLIIFKVYGIYVATASGIALTFFVLMLSRIVQGRFSQQQLITLIIFIIFGGLTLYFHNPIFVKWKPTIIFWIFALCVLGAPYFKNKYMVQILMQPLLEIASVPQVIWQRLNVLWFISCFILGLLNLYVAYYCSLDTWVDFKVFGITAFLFIFSITQACYLSKYLGNENESRKNG